MGWAIVGIVGGLLLLDLVIRWQFVQIILPIFEQMPAFGVQPGQPDRQAEEVQIPTTDGLKLQGSLYRQPNGQSRGLILFCPELGGNRWLALSYCQGLWQAGFEILAFDFRNQGDSESLPGYEPLHWLTTYEVDDVLAAVDYAQRHPDLKTLPLGAFGVSRGGGAALMAAACRSAVQCVACDSVFSTDQMMQYYTRRWASLYVPQWVINWIPAWHIRSTLAFVRLISQRRRGCRYTVLERWLPRLRSKAVFLVTGARDSYVPAELTRRLGQQIGPACEDVWIVAGAKHNMARQMASQEYDRRMVSFFSRHLVPSGPIKQHA